MIHRIVWWRIQITKKNKQNKNRGISSKCGNEDLVYNGEPEELKKRLILIITKDTAM